MNTNLQKTEDNSLLNTANNNNFQITSNSSIGALGERDVEEGKAESQLVRLMIHQDSKNIFENILNKYLCFRDIECLRLVCRRFRKVFFERGLFHLKIDSTKIRSVINRTSYVNLYPRIPNSISAASQRLPAEVEVEDIKELQTLLKDTDTQFTIRRVIFKHGVDDATKLPQNIQYLKIRNIPRGCTVNLSQYNELQSVKVETMYGAIKLPVGTTSFEVGKLQSDVTIDLSSCKQLRSVKIRDINSGIILPKGIRTFEGGNIHAKTPLNLSHGTHLQSVKVGDIYGGIILPEGIRTFEGGNIDTETPLNLGHCKQLRSVKIGERIEGNLILPEQLMIFKGGSIRAKTPLDLSHCAQLQSVKVGDIYSSLILPDGIMTFEGGNIDTKTPLDLGHCKQLRSVKIGSHIGSNLILPEQIMVFEGGSIVRNTTLDLRCYEQLQSVKVGDIVGELYLPKGIIAFKGGDIIDPKFDLSQYEQLQRVKIRNTKGAKGIQRPLYGIEGRGECEVETHGASTHITFIFPQGITEFEGWNIIFGTALDLRKCLQLQSVKVNGIEGILILPKALKGKKDIVTYNYIRGNKCITWK